MNHHNKNFSNRKEDNFNEALNKTIEWYLKNPKFYSAKQRRKFDKRLGLIND